MTKEYKIKSIKKIGKKRVINLTVHKNHTFITKNGIITHNCGYISQNAQALLRGDIEAFFETARFIFTENYPEKIISPLLQRLEIYDFDEIYQNNKKELAKQIYERLIFILENESIKFNKKDIIEIVKTFFPSLREMIIFIQKNIFNNELKLSQNQMIESDYFIKIFKEVKRGDFYTVKELVDGIISPDTFYSFMWKNLEKIIDDKDLAKTIILLADYYEQHAKAKNKYIPIMAFLVRLMTEKISFKA